MIKRILVVLGFILIIIGLFWVKGPAVQVHEYFYAFMVIAIGISLLWFGNKDLFKKENNNNEKQ